METKKSGLPADRMLGMSLAGRKRLAVIPIDGEDTISSIIGQCHPRNFSRLETIPDIPVDVFGVDLVTEADRPSWCDESPHAE